MAHYADAQAPWPAPYGALEPGYWLWYTRELGQGFQVLGVYPHEPPETEGSIHALQLEEAVPLLGLDSTRILRQMSQLTRLKDAVEDLIGGLMP